jgi:hypothetical protein
MIDDLSSWEILANEFLRRLAKRDMKIWRARRDGQTALYEDDAPLADQKWAAYEAARRIADEGGTRGRAVAARGLFGARSYHKHWARPETNVRASLAQQWACGI